MAKQNKGRKFFAASATAALVASAIVPVASAATSTIKDFDKVAPYAKEAVQALVDAGVISGDEKGNFNPTNSITRAEAAKIFTGALELEAEGDVDFKDVKKDAWYYDAIAATVEYGIFEGVSATEFAPNKNLTRSEAAKILVEAFELEGEADLKDFADASTVKPWAKSYLEVAVANGIIKGSEVNGKTNLNPNASITRQEFAVVFSRTLELAEDTTVKVDKIEVVDAKTLNVTLTDGTKETVTLETALEPNKETEVTFKIKDVEYKAKVTYVVTTATAVKSVSATNLKEVVVEFDGTVDKETAEEASNYTLKSGKAVKSVKLSDDKKTATVTVVGTLANNKADAISISNVKAGDKVINVKNVEFTTVDNKLPEVTAVKSLGTKSVKLEFSEPVKGLQQSNFTLDGKAYFGKVTMGANDRSVILTPFSSTALSVGDHKLTVAGVKDYADFVSLSSTHEFKVVEDKEAPTVTEATATLETVTLTFSEDVDVETVKASNVYWKSGDTKKAAYEVEAIADNKYKFFFKEANSLPTGKVDVFVEGVKDYSDNQIAKDTKVTVTPEIDQTRPEVKKVTVEDARTIKVTFSKTIKESTAVDVKNYTVLNKDGKVVSVQSAKLDPKDSKSVIINLYSDLSNGENTLTIKNLKDTTKLENTMLDYSEKIVKADKDAPKFTYSVNTKDNRVVLKFNKKMDIETLTDKSNYLVSIDESVQGLNSDIADISVGQDATAVTITFAETIKGKEVVFADKKSPNSDKVHVNTLTVLGLKDANGNYLEEFTNQGSGEVKANVVPLKESTNLKLAEFDAKKHAGKVAELIDARTIKVHFNTGVNSATSGAFTATVDGKEVAIDSVQADGTSDVIIKLKKDLEDTGAAKFDLTINFPSLVDIAGNTGKEITGAVKVVNVGTDAKGNLLDSVKPVIVDNDKDYEVKNNEDIYITYSEALKFDDRASQDLRNSDFTVIRNSDNETLGRHEYKVEIANENQIKITLLDTADRDVATFYKVEVKDAKYFTDKSDNAISDSKGVSQKVTYVTASSDAEKLAAAKVALAKAITDAKAVTAVTEGKEVGNKVEGSKVILDAAITKAEAVHTSTTSTLKQVTDEEKALDDAVKAYEDANVVGITLAKLDVEDGTPATTKVELATGETLEVKSGDDSIAKAAVASDTITVTYAGIGNTEFTVNVLAGGKVVKTGKLAVEAK